MRSELFVAGLVLLIAGPALAGDDGGEEQEESAPDGADESIPSGEADPEEEAEADPTQEPEEEPPEATEAEPETPAEPQPDPDTEPEAPPVPVVPEIPGVPDLPPLPPMPPVPDVAGPSGAIIPSAPIAMPPPPEVRFGGFVAFDWQPYLLPLDGAVDSVVQVRVAPRIEARFQFVRAVADLELRHDFVDTGRNRLIVREAFAGLRWKGLRFEAGALLPRWGKMDVASPTDNVVAQDYEDLFFPEALPVPGILLGYARGPVSFEALVLPGFRPSRFRGASASRWDITRFLPTSQEIPIVFDTATVANNYQTFLPAALDGDAEIGRGIEVGARVDFSLPVVDLGFSFLATRDRLPTYTAYRTLNADDGDGDGQPDVLVSGVADIEVTPHHRRILVPGVDLAAVLGPVVLKGEAAFFATEDPSRTSCLVDDPYVKYAFGAELILSNLVGDFDVAIRAQYNGDVALPAGSKDGPDRFEGLAFSYLDGGEQGNYERGCFAISYDSAQDDALPTDFATGFTGTPEQRHPYTHGFFWNVNLAFTRAVSLDLRGFFDVAGDALFIPKLQLLLLDRLAITAGATVVLDTGDDTIFSPYRRNHRVEIGARYDF